LEVIRYGSLDFDTVEEGAEKLARRIEKTNAYLYVGATGHFGADETLERYKRCECDYFDGCNMRDEEKRIFIGRIIFGKVGRVGRIKVSADGRKIEAEN